MPEEYEGEDDPEKNEELDQLTKLIDGAVMRLLEHVDSVQIFVTKHKPGGKDTSTLHYTWGDGNWFTRYGQIKAWVVRQEEILRNEVK